MSLVRKLECAKEFVEILVSKLGSRVCRVVLFGSVARGDADAYSDVDMLIVLDKVLDGDREIIAQTAFDISLKYGESVEYLIMSFEEYKLKGLSNPLIYEIEKWGKILHQNPRSEEERTLKLVRLAEEYFMYAAKCKELMMYRASIDLGQNAIELLLKALILVKGQPLPKTHGGYIHKFGELYVLTGEVGRTIISRLYEALELRNKSRYDPEYTPNDADAGKILQIYKEFKELTSKFIQ